MTTFPETDWKLRSKLKSLALGRLCQRILDQATLLAAPQEIASAHERYLRLYEHIHESDEAIALGFNNCSRSNAMPMLITWRREGVITDSEFAQFSSETQAGVNSFIAMGLE